MRRWLVRLVLLLLGLVAGVTAYGYLEAQRDPVIVRYRVGLIDWPANTPPMRIVQMSDIHIAWPDMSTARLAGIVAQVNALKPDLVVLTGDYHGGKIWDRRIGNLDTSIAPFTKLRARYGVVAVRGNHDGPYWSPIVFGRTSIRLLQNRWIVAGPIIVAGMDDITGPGDPAQRVRDTVASVPPGKPLIVVAHQPSFFQWLPPRAGLLIAGHTHGGQIKLPLYGAPITGQPYLDKHLRGQFFEPGKQMIVSSGIGTSIVPLRIDVSPEIVEITLAPRDGRANR